MAIVLRALYYFVKKLANAGVKDLQINLSEGTVTFTGDFGKEDRRAVYLSQLWDGDAIALGDTTLVTLHIKKDIDETTPDDSIPLFDEQEA